MKRLCLCLQVVEDMLEVEEEEDDRDDKVIIVPGAGRLGTRSVDAAPLSDR